MKWRFRDECSLNHKVSRDGFGESICGGCTWWPVGRVHRPNHTRSRSVPSCSSALPPDFTDSPPPSRRRTTTFPWTSMPPGGGAISLARPPIEIRLSRGFASVVSERIVGNRDKGVPVAYDPNARRNSTRRGAFICNRRAVARPTCVFPQTWPARNSK